MTDRETMARSGAGVGAVAGHDGGRRRGVAGGVVSWPPALGPFLAAGSAAVISGGLVAAVARPSGWAQGSWTAAFLVLVAGVGQVGLGAGQAALARSPLRRRTVVVESCLWNGGCAGVLVGTLANVPLAVTSGGLLLVVALGLFALTPRATAGPRARLRRLYYGLVLILLVSVPIGLVLAWRRT